jgi:hypothetical protein
MENKKSLWRRKHQDRIYMENRLKTICKDISTRITYFDGTINISWVICPLLYHNYTQETQLKSIMITQGQLIMHSQTLATNLATLEAMVEQVLNDDHAMVKLKGSFEIEVKALVNISRNYWRPKHLIYHFFSKVFKINLTKSSLQNSGTIPTY